MREYSVFAARILTVQGNKLAIAGLCHKDKTSECESLLVGLDELRFDTDSPLQIDTILADRLSALFNGKAVAVGATAYIKSANNYVYRTGGVLGRPEADAEDAGDELEELDDGVWMYTISGGPGWIGFFSRDKAERLAGHTFNQSVVYPAQINEIYRELTALSPDSYIFISDGTGYDSFGICAAKSGDKEMCYFV